ncbi:MAG: SpoIIE family protein phosphatase [Clostridia bacterium]|nr:SpoIIE family protein phosphatase [Clostridia bacterium]
MDTEKLGIRQKKNRRGEAGFFARELAKRTSDRSALLADLLTFLVALVFARTHILFGAYPLGAAFVAVLPVRVWAALVGAVIGSLTLGSRGVIYAVTAVIVVLLRVIISGTDRHKDGSRRQIFSENILLRMSSTVLGGFIAAVYEVLLSGFQLKSVLFGVACVVLPPMLVFTFCGLFDSGIRLEDFFSGRRNIFALSGKRSRERYNIIFFQCSALLFCFFLSLSLAEYSLFGISAAYLFASFATLFAAKRFGPLRAMAVGFAATFGLSGLYSVAFALAGLAAGALFSLGVWFALVGAAALISAWCAYTGGLVGLLETLPEYIIAAVVGLPFYSRLFSESGEEEIVENERLAADMVGTMTLAYRNRQNESLDSLEESISAISPLVRRLGEADARPTREEYRDLFIDCTDKFCKTCEGYRGCVTSGGARYLERADEIAEKLWRGERIKPEELGTPHHLCRDLEHVADGVNHAAALLEEEKFKARKLNFAAEDFELIAKMINEARVYDRKERALDEELSERLSEVFCEGGFPDGVIRAFGERRKYFIAAGEDKDGKKITAPELKREIERCAGVKLGTPEYFRKGSMVLFECSAAPAYKVDCAFAGLSRSDGEVSGDTARSFETKDGRHYALISDGMGSGELAKETSTFVADFLERVLNTGISHNTAMYMLNHIIRRRTSECSATVDLFEMDLVGNEAVFVKSGAAPSYIKRHDSIFRVRSQTAPLGLIKTVDAEKIRVEVRAEDYVIMFSDGISQTPEDAPWLLELLAKEPKRNLAEYADYILAEAASRNSRRDDMSVMVMKISARAD